MEQLLRFSGSDIQNIDFDPWLEQKSEVLRPIAAKWFDAIKDCGPDVVDIFHDDYPIGCVDEAPFAYINVFAKHVNVGFFYGVDLPDPTRILEGTGRRMRHIKLFPDRQVADAAVHEILQHAYLDIKERLCFS